MDDHQTSESLTDNVVYPQPKDADDCSHITAADGTVDMDLSLSMDLSFNLVEHSQEASSPICGETSSEVSNQHSTDGNSCHEDAGDTVVDVVTVAAEVDLECTGHQEIDTEEESDIDAEAETTHNSVPKQQRENRVVKGPDENAGQADGNATSCLNQSSGSPRETGEDQSGPDQALPGAFKVYSKLAAVRHEKEERCYGSDKQLDDVKPKTPPTTPLVDISRQLSAAIAEQENSPELKVEEKELKTRGGSTQYIRTSPLGGGYEKNSSSKRSSAARGQRKPPALSALDTTPQSQGDPHCIERCVTPTIDRRKRATTTEHDASESESSNLASFLEDLSESIDEIAQSPRRHTSRSKVGGSPRESIMQRRVMQKRRRSTAATEPGAIESSNSNHENSHDPEQVARMNNDGDLLFLPPLGQSHVSDDGRSSVSSFTDMQPDSLDLEQGLKWPEAITAELVADTSLKDDERAKVIQETTIALTSNAVPAEVVDLDAIVEQKVSEGNTRNARCRRIYSLISCMVFCAVVSAVVASLLLTASPSVSLAPNTATEAPTASPAPTPFTHGSSVFRSRDELLNAVDEYVQALYLGQAENSSVAVRYGYPMGSWDVSMLTDFSRLFDIKRHSQAQEAVLAFNEDLGGWDVTMSYMFAGLALFEGKGLYQWNVENVLDFSFMFAGTPKFKENLSIWNTSSAMTTASMFSFGSYNSGIAEWDMSNVETTASMFRFSTTSSNSTFDLNRWNVSNVKDMSQMFLGSDFNGRIDQWDVRNVRTMSSMFSQSSFNQNIGTWRTQHLTDLRGIFGLGSYRGNLTNWDTSNVADFSFAFFNSSFDGDVSTWNTSNGQTFVAMFSLAENFDGDLSLWDMRNAEDCKGMFAKSKSFTGKGTSEWDVSNLKNAHEMFAWAVSFREDISSWNTSSLEDATLMLVSTTSFNHSLCAWSDEFPTDAKVNDMFLNSGCSVMTAPDLQANSTSFCTTCERL